MSSGTSPSVSRRSPRRLLAGPIEFGRACTVRFLALQGIDRAMAIDPDDGWVTALAACGHAQLRAYHSVSAPEATRATALRLSDRAALLAPDEPLVLTARATVHTMLRDFPAADVLIARALAMDPTSSWAWERSAWLRSGQGRFDEGCAHFARALRLDPLSRSTTNRTATDCTRPAERPRRTFSHRSGDSL